jgi:hypothetical protein
MQIALPVFGDLNCMPVALELVAPEALSAEHPSSPLLLSFIDGKEICQVVWGSPNLPGRLTRGMKTQSKSHLRNHFPLLPRPAVTIMHMVIANPTFLYQNTTEHPNERQVSIYLMDSTTLNLPHESVRGISVSTQPNVKSEFDERRGVSRNALT